MGTDDRCEPVIGARNEAARRRLPQPETDELVHLGCAYPSPCPTLRHRAAAGGVLGLATKGAEHDGAFGVRELQAELEVCPLALGPQPFVRDDTTQGVPQLSRPAVTSVGERSHGVGDEIGVGLRGRTEHWLLRAGFEFFELVGEADALCMVALRVRDEQRCRLVVPGEGRVALRALAGGCRLLELAAHGPDAGPLRVERGKRSDGEEPSRVELAGQK